MRVIFLDWDGVILLISTNGPYDPELKANTEAIGNLNLLVQLTEAEVVVTSNWRNGRSVEQLEALDRFGRKSAENLIVSIERARRRPLARILYALGIPQVGEQTAIDLAAPGARPHTW